MSVKAAFFGGPWADQVRKLDSAPPVLDVPLPVELTVAHLDASPEMSSFTYERAALPWHGLWCYFPRRPGSRG